MLVAVGWCLFGFCVTRGLLIRLLVGCLSVVCYVIYGLLCGYWDVCAVIVNSVVYSFYMMYLLVFVFCGLFCGIVVGMVVCVCIVISCGLFGLFRFGCFAFVDVTWLGRVCGC